APLGRPGDGETLWLHPVPAHHARARVDFARRPDLRIIPYLGDTLVVDEVDERGEYYLTIAQVEPEVVDDLMQALERGEPTKCLLVGEPGPVAELLPRMQAAVPDLQISRSKPRFIEVTRRGIRKDVALAAVAARIGQIARAS